MIRFSRTAYFILSCRIEFSVGTVGASRLSMVDVSLQAVFLGDLSDKKPGFWHTPAGLLVLLFIRHDRKRRACPLVMNNRRQRAAVWCNGHINNGNCLPVILIGFLDLPITNSPE